MGGFFGSTLFGQYAPATSTYGVVRRIVISAGYAIRHLRMGGGNRTV